EKNEQNEYTISEAGRQFVLASPPPPAGDETPPGEETEETLKTTEYQQFIEIGRATGVVPMALISQTANHIWRGGDFRDLTWVWKGLTEMGIRPDLAQRWFHSWRSFLHQAIPPEVASQISPPQASAEKAATAKGEAAGKGKRDYILGANDTPLHVGEGLGDLDYEDAVRLSTVRAAAQARGGALTGQPGTPGTMADEVVKIFNAFKETTGPQTKGKSYIVKPGEEGYTVEEVEEGKPTLVTAPGTKVNPSPSFLVDSEGNVSEAPPGRPIVIKQLTQPPSSPGKTYLVRQTPEGMVTEEFDVGKPIIINAPAPSPGSGMPPMMPFPVIGGDGQPVYDQDGKPVYANIEPMLKWMTFQDERRRADERHNALVGLGQAVKESWGDGISALKAAVEEAKGSSGAKPPATVPQQTFECGDCHTSFSPPPGWTDQPIKCPN
ncbi:unnamed protein product, partial [marine sediment metagenome]